MKNWILIGLLPLVLTGCFGAAGGNGANAIDDDLSPNIATSTGKVQQLVRMGDEAADRGDAETALRFYSAANKVDAKDPAPLLASAKILEAKADFNAAARLYDALAADRDAADRLTLQLAAARSYLKGKNYAEAAVRYERLTNQTGDWRAFNGLGVVRDLEGNQATAIRAYQTALDKAPADDKAKVRANLGLSYLLDGNAQKTIDLLEPLEKSGELSTMEQRYLALAYGFKGRTADAQRLGLDEPPTYEAVKQSMESMEGPGVKAAPSSKVTKAPVQ